jgi:hypothetical protein
VQAKNIVDLSSAGAIGEFGGIVIAGALMGSAITGADFGTTPNAINTLGSFGVSGGAFILDDGGIAGNLTVSGPVSATNVSINDSGTITATGGVTASAGTLKLATAGSGGLLLNAGAILTGVTVDLDASGGGITEASGVINAATLLSSGGVTGNVQLTNLNSVGTLGNFSAGSFGLNDGTALLIAGALNAADIQIRAPASQISLGDGAIITTGGTTRPPGPLQAALEPANGGPGALLQATNFAQIGSSTVQGHGGSPATLQISTVGTVLFDPSLGLQAPGTWLILSLSNGMSGGNVFVSALDVTYTTPNSTNLFGTIAGITGGHAAAVGAIQPAVNNAYLFNSCVIGAAVCTNTPVTPPIIPTAPPIIPTAPVAVTPLNVGLTATLGAIEPLVTVPPPMLTAVPGMTLVALPMLQVRPPQLTDPDVVPPNISYLDY